MTVRFHPEAREELLEAAKYYRQSASPDVALAFARAFREARRFIEEAAESSRLRAHGTRRVNLKGFPYYVSYLVGTNEIWIVAVAHSARRPFYWRQRLEEGE
jgi:plasmid stabilization system protein ParE